MFPAVLLADTCIQPEAVPAQYMQKLPHDTDYSLFSRLGNTLSFSDAWSGSVKVGIHYDANLEKAFFFPDIGLTWKGKKGLRVRMEALNLLDLREYAYVLLSPLLEESYRLKIRPLTVLVAVDWQF